MQAALGLNPGTAANDLNSIWVNPDPASFGLAENLRPAPDGSTNGANSATDANNSMQSIIIGAGIATAGAAPNDTNMDEIRVGDTWADVTSNTTIPEPTTIGMSGVAILAILAIRWRNR